LLYPHPQSGADVSASRHYQRCFLGDGGEPKWVAATTR